MSTVKSLSVLLFFMCFLFNCANQKVLHPSPKIGFDINALDKEGLAGPPDGKVAVSYEFCIPALSRFVNEIVRIDPSIKVHKKSKGRVACDKQQWLCIGNTHQELYRQKLQRLAELEYIKRIEKTVFE